MKRRLESPPRQDRSLEIDLTSPPSSSDTHTAVDRHHDGTTTGTAGTIEKPEGVDQLVWSQLPEDVRLEISRNPSVFFPVNDRAIDSRQETPKLHHMGWGEKEAKAMSVPPLFRTSHMSATSSEFTDTQFVAGPQSIDGRRDVRTTAPNCKCTKTARLCRVSKDGVNQGRNFYGCFTRACSYFEWADDAPHKEGALKYQWRRFRTTGEGSAFQLVVPNRGFRGADVIQGGVGDCWFLSAVVVIAERRDLIERVVPQRTLRADGSCSFMLFIDGKWTEVIVDNQLPCKAPTASSSAATRTTFTMSDLVYSKGKLSQLWVPLLEKAYAKAHGSYDAISGGFIAEALLDLTAAPCETVAFFGEDFDSEELWMKLVSYHQSKFPMGCSTDSTGEGIVGNHAYSILDVREISGARLGAQQQISDFLNSESSSASMFDSSISSDIVEDLRFVRIRNPWGRVEWNGDMSKGSEMWTTRLAAELGGAGAKNDGTFWMLYHDFLRRFTSVDICKCFDNPDWLQFSETGLINPHHFCAYSQFELILEEEYTWLFIYVVQSTKRGKTRNRDDRSYWYSDISVIISAASNGDVIAASFGGHRRDNVPIEVHLERGRYIINIIHLSPHKRLAKSTGDLFRLLISSSKPVHLQMRPCSADATVRVPENAEHFINVHHRGSLNVNEKCSISSSSVVAAMHKCVRSSLRIYMFSPVPAAADESKALLGLRYLKSKTQPKIVALDPRDALSAAIHASERPQVHFLHGRGGIAFLVLVNTSAIDVECSLHVIVPPRSKIVSPYEIIEPHVAAADSIPTTSADRDAPKQHLLRTHCPQLSFVIAAAVIENSFLVESGMTLSVALTPLSNYGVTAAGAGCASAKNAIENPIFAPVQLLD